jgi:hypothetical protein
MTMRRAFRLVGVVVGASLLSGCVSPAFDHGAFHQNAAGAIESGLSETLTARLAVGALLEHKVTGAFADVVITDSEGALGPIQASFGNVDPPTRPDDKLRDDVLSLLGDAENALARARIAARRGDESGLREAQGALQKVGDRLEQAKEQLG